MKNQILCDYIRKQRKRGFSYEKIRDYLLSYQYNSVDVDDCIKYVKDETTVITNVILMITVVAIIVVIAYLNLNVTFEEPTKEQSKLFNENLTKDEILEVVKEVKVNKGTLYIDQLILPEGNSYSQNEEIKINYKLQNIQSVNVNSRFMTAYIINPIIINPDNNIDSDLSKPINRVYQNEFNEKNRFEVESSIGLILDETNSKGTYQLILNFVDIYNNEEAAAAVTIEIK